MHLRNLKENEKIEARIDLITSKELKSIQRNEEFEFDWNQEKGHEIYKLYRTDTEEILGLMSVVNAPVAVAVEIKLLEVGKTNRGSHKEIDRIAGCLIAWACRLSFQRGYHGWIKLIAKTDLIPHYKKRYGMIQIGGRQTCCIEQEQAIRLIEAFLKK